MGNEETKKQRKSFWRRLLNQHGHGTWFQVKEIHDLLLISQYVPEPLASELREEARNIWPEVFA